MSLAPVHHMKVCLCSPRSECQSRPFLPVIYVQEPQLVCTGFYCPALQIKLISHTAKHFQKLHHIRHGLLPNAAARLVLDRAKDRALHWIHCRH